MRLPLVIGMRQSPTPLPPTLHNQLRLYFPNANSHNTVLYTMARTLSACAPLSPNVVCACARQNFLRGIASCADTHRATMPSIEVSQCVCLLTLLWSLVEVHSQTSTPFISFMGNTLDNHSYVEFSEVGRAGDGSDSVRCRTELVMCCSSVQGDFRGDWFFPSGAVLPFPGTGNDPFEARGAQTVDLRRNTALSPSGLYRCDIAFDADDPWEYTTMEVLNSTVFSLRSHKNCITHSYR